MRIFLPGEFQKLNAVTILSDVAWQWIARAKAEGIPLTVNEARAMFAGFVPPHPDPVRGAADVSAAETPQAGDDQAPTYSAEDESKIDPAVKKEDKP